MVWTGVCATGKPLLAFVEEGVKINSAVYQEILKEKVLRWAHGPEDWESFTQFGDRQFFV